MRLLAAKTGVMLAKPAALAIPWSSLGISGKSYCRPPHKSTVCAPSCNTTGHAGCWCSLASYAMESHTVQNCPPSKCP